MMMTGPILYLLNQALADGYDEDRLRAYLGELILLIWVLLPCDPILSRRLKLLVPEHGGRLKVYDAEDVVDAFEAIAGKNPDDHLRVQLLTLRVVIAQLGGVHSAMRLGRLAAEELRK